MNTTLSCITNKKEHDKLMKKEKLKIEFKGFKLSTEDPSNKTLAIVAMVLVFLVVITYAAAKCAVG